MQSLMQDLRYGWRGLRQRPGFTFIAVLTLALGIGANAAIFSLIDGILLRPLPYDAPENLIRVWQTSTRNPQLRIHASALNFRDWRRDNTVFTEMAAYFSSTAYNLTGAGDAERISGAPVSASLFGLLGRRPALGREFRVDEDRPGAPHVVLLSHGMWQSRFAGDPDIVDRTLTLDGEPYTIIGVMPSGSRLAPVACDSFVSCSPKACCSASAEARSVCCWRG